ncbi:MAG: hypothetical protein WBW69_10970 [Candidatus Korobacteraceae bacterium]
MPSTTDRGENSGLSGSSDCVLHVAYICATRDKAWFASYHAIPNGTRVFIPALAGAQ